jgi:hypothetical protein
VTTSAHARSVGAAVRRLARAVGIVLIFSVVGPLALAALISLIIVALGVPLLQAILVFVDLEAMRTLLSVAAWLLAIASLLAALLPSVAAGLIFALAAVYAQINAVWMAWLAAVAAIGGFVGFGIFVIPAESSALILPTVRSAQQGLELAAMLTVLALMPTTLCWWLTRPLHRASIAA